MSLTSPGGYTTKKRMAKLHASIGRSSEIWASFPSWNTSNTIDCDVIAEESIHGRKNSWPRGAGKGDVGGNVTIIKHEYENSHGSIRVQDGGTNPRRQYTGSLHASGTAGKFQAPSVWPAPFVMSDANLLNLGVTAISRTIPTAPAAGVATALGELRAGLPKVPLSALRQASSLAARRKAVGSEYLNVEFGWKPLLSDVRKTVDAARESEKILTQFHRDSGRQIRRRYSFPTQSDTRTISEGRGEFYPAMPTAYFVGGVSSGVRTVTETQTTRSWFSGCYTYYVPQGQSRLAKIQRYEQSMNRLYGTRVTPEVLYNLTPWSWLADWQTNLGDSIKNVSAFAADGLVMRWGYIMTETRVTRTYTLSGIPWKTFTGGPTTISESYTTVVKQRMAASPYGFGVKSEALSGRQIAILAALGISR